MWSTMAYTSADLPAIIELTKSFYGDIEISNYEFLKWQYEDNPAGQAIITLAKDSEQSLLAGQYAMIPIRFQQGDKIVRGTLSLNTLTRKEYWGKGIFTKLAEEAYSYCRQNGLTFTYGFPNPNSYPGFVSKLRFLDIGQAPLLLRPLNLKSLVSKKLTPGLAPLCNLFKPIYRFRKKEFKGLHVFQLSLEHLHLIDRFWHKIKNKYPILTLRNSEFIKWRYFDIPLREYILYAVRSEDSEDILGYIAGRCTEVSGMRSGMIVDFIIEKNNFPAGKALINQLLEYFTEKDMEISGSLMLNETEEYQLLKGNGFFKCPRFLQPQPFPVIYRSHREDSSEDELIDLNNWFLTMGDYDVI